MLQFYASRGSSAVAAHILLEEVGAAYEITEVSIPDAAHKEPAFLAINPKGRLPALGTPGGVVTENPAILEYIAATHGGAAWLPHDPMAQAQARSLAAYLCATAHVAFAHMHRGARWASHAASHEDMRNRVADNLADCAAHLETTCAFAPFALGGAYTYCDPYIFQFTRWCTAAGVCLNGYPKLSDHRSMMRDRPAVGRALAWHGDA